MIGLQPQASFSLKDVSTEIPKVVAEKALGTIFNLCRKYPGVVKILFKKNSLLSPQDTPVILLSQLFDLLRQKYFLEKIDLVHWIIDILEMANDFLFKSYNLTKEELEKIHVAGNDENALQVEEKIKIAKLQEKLRKKSQKMFDVCTESALSMLVRMLAETDLSKQKTQSIISILKNISAIQPKLRAVILKELSTAIILQANAANENFQPLLNSMENSKAIDILQLSGRGQNEFKLMRLLQAYIAVFSIPSEDVSTSIRYLKYEDLEKLLQNIEKYLQLIPQTNLEALSTSPLCSQLLPLIQIFVEFHSGQLLKSIASTSELSTLVSPSTPTSHLRRNDKLEKFLDANRGILNAILKAFPTLLTTSLSVLMQYPKYIDFDNKRVWFNQKLREDYPSRRYGTLRLTVRRSNVFMDSFVSLHRKLPDELKGRLIVKFQGEEAVDAGGVTREWFLILAKEIFNPDYALFLQSPNTTFQPNPASYVNTEHISYFKFVGKVIAMAVYNEKLLECYFTRSFYKHILGIPCNYHDLEAMDPSLYKNLRWILDNDVNDVIFQNFEAETMEFGKKTVLELKPGGSNIPVTNENKEEYINLYSKMLMTTAIKEQLNAFVQGFYEIIPQKYIEIFNENQLELLISGLPEIDINDLYRNTEYYGYTKTDTIILWFWKTLRSFGKDDKALFVQFFSGTSKVPLGGFAMLRGMSDIQKFNIHQAPGEDRLPTAHTCFNQLDLPSYSSEEVLKEKLLLAIREGSEGFSFV